METKTTMARFLLALAAWRERGWVKKKSHISRPDPHIVGGKGDEKLE